MTTVAIRRVPRRTRRLPHWAWHITTSSRRRSGYAHTWWGAGIAVARRIRVSS